MEQVSPCSTTAESVLCSPGAAALEAQCSRACAPQQEKPLPWDTKRGSPAHCNWTSACAAMKTLHSQINKKTAYVRKLWSPRSSLCQAPLPGQLAWQFLWAFILIFICSPPHTTYDCCRYVALPGYRFTFSISSSWAQEPSTFPGLPWLRLWSCDWALTNGMQGEVIWAISRFAPWDLPRSLSLSVHRPAECRGYKRGLQDRASLHSIQESLLET